MGRRLGGGRSLVPAALALLLFPRRTPLRLEIVPDHLVVPALLATERRVPSVHEDVAVPGEVLPAEGAGVHGVAAGLALAAAVEWLDAKEGRGGRRSHHFSVLEELSLRVPTRLLHLLKH